MALSLLCTTVAAYSDVIIMWFHGISGGEVLFGHVKRMGSLHACWRSGGLFLLRLWLMYGVFLCCPYACLDFLVMCVDYVLFGYTRLQVPLSLPNTRISWNVTQNLMFRSDLYALANATKSVEDSYSLECSPALRRVTLFVFACTMSSSCW